MGEFLISSSSQANVLFLPNGTFLSSQQYVVGRQKAVAPESLAPHMLPSACIIQNCSLLEAIIMAKTVIWGHMARGSMLTEDACADKGSEAKH